MDDFFDELDPCCQKELLNNKKQLEVSKILRASDRSYQRSDLVAKTFSPWYKTDCRCCNTSEDYSALILLRSKSKMQIDCVLSKNKSDESDSDSDTDFMDGFEDERTIQFRSLHNRIEFAKKLGFASHLNDSVEHVKTLVQIGIPIVLHLYNPHSLICAKLDLYLESICTTYLGTRFRRVLYSNEIISDLIFAGNIFNSNKSSLEINQGGGLFCFHNKQLTSASYTLNQFSDGEEELYTDEVLKFLEHARVLNTELSLEVYSSTSSNDLVPTNSDGEQHAKESYCDDPDCIRRYPHEHIGNRSSDSNNNKEQTTPSFLYMDNEEIFAKNALKQL